MSKIGAKVWQQPTPSFRAQLNQTAVQLANLPEGVCTGNLQGDIDKVPDDSTDKSNEIPKFIREEIMKCAKENLLLNPGCRCSIYELTYWSWCRKSLASEALGIGGILGDLANEVLITTIIDPREKFLHKQISAAGLGCKVTAYSSSSSSTR